VNTLLRDRSSQEITEERVMMNLQLLALPDATPSYPILRKVGPADLKDALTKGANDFLPILDFLGMMNLPLSGVQRLAPGRSTASCGFSF
jgi:hypothetical protein